jgi:hypothetical protein
MLVFVLACPFVVALKNTDFDKAYYAAARELWHTGSLHYSYEGLKSLPIVAGLLSPLGALDRETAAAIFLSLELTTYLAAFLVAAWGIGRTTGERWLWLALFVTCRAWFVSLRLGQLTPVCLLLLLLAFVAFERERPKATGACLALAFLVKIPAGLVLLPLVVRRRWDVVGAAAVGFALLMGLSLALYGLAPHAGYWDAVIVQNAGSGLTAYNNVSLLGAALRVTQALGSAPEGLFRWAPVPVPPVTGAAVWAACAALLAGVTLAVWRAPRDSQREAWPFDFSLALCASLVVFPVVWDHYLAFVLVPLFLVIRAARRESHPWLTVAGIFAAVNFPTRWLLSALDSDWQLLRSLVPAVPLLGVLGLLYLVLVQHRELRSRARSVPT